MNDQKIYELIAKHGRVRAVQLADWLDEDLSDVSQALRGLVDVGDVVQARGTAPNGQPSMFYELSADFIRSRAGKDILARVNVDPAPNVAEPEAPAPAAPEAMPDEPAAGTYAERAVAYLTKHGDTPNEVLRMALGLAREQAPANFLKSAINAGKLHKDGGIWRLGKGRAWNGPTIPSKGGPVASFDPKAPIEYPAGTEKPAAGAFDTLLKAPEPAQPAAVPVPPVAVAAPVDLAKLKTEPAPVAVPVFVPPAPAATAPVYRAALWSDGILELQRDGQTVLTCTRGEGEFLSSFLARTLGEAGKVAA
jgi:hypothetical protein